MDIVKAAAGVASITDLIGRVAGFGDRALDVAELVAGIFPGGGTVLAAIRSAHIIVDRIAAAAPKVRGAIEAGTPIAQAVQQHGPDLVSNLKGLYAIAVNADPERPESDMTARAVSDEQALAFVAPVLFGRAWTKEEEQRWFDKAQGATPT